LDESYSISLKHFAAWLHGYELWMDSTECHSSLSLFHGDEMLFIE